MLCTLATLIGAAGLFSGCAGSPTAEGVNTTASLTCVDDTAHCIGQRKAALTSMTSDPSRKWVKEPAGALAHASGVRLFAFKTKKKDLSCDELSAGKKRQTRRRARSDLAATGSLRRKCRVG
jgi:hypothetical protein